jgi:hypothetical protein
MGSSAPCEIVQWEQEPRTTAYPVPMLVHQLQSSNTLVLFALLNSLSGDTLQIVSLVF